MLLPGLIKPLLSLIGSGQLSILIYHRVLKEKDSLMPEIVDAEDFQWQMELIAKHFTVLPLSEAIELLALDKLPRRAICITFDDGYADNVEVALPILKNLDLTATFFISVGFLNGGLMWNDAVIESIRCISNESIDLSDSGLKKYKLSTDVSKRACIESIIGKIKHLPQDKRQAIVDSIVEKATDNLPNQLMMSTEQIRELQIAGMELGAHTITHPILSTLDRECAFNEIINGKKMLEEIIGGDVNLFAYPNGKPGLDYLQEHTEMVDKAGFLGAVSTSMGVSGRKTDRYQLRRFTPWDKTPNKFLLRLVKNYLTR